MSSRRKHHEEENHERWLVSYADFITLLFAFFVILYATSQRDVEKTKSFEESVKKFLVKAGAGAMNSGGAVSLGAGEKNLSILEPPIPTHRSNTPDQTKLVDSVEASVEGQLTESDRKKYLLDLSPDDKGVRITLASPAIFSGDGAKFEPSAVAFLDRLGTILKSEDRPLMLEGHVNRGQRGSFASPWDLASARSINLLRYLQGKNEFPGAQLGASTFGDSRPLTRKAGGSDRIEIVVYSRDVEF